MRLLFGLILGAALTIGGAWLHDNRLPADSGERLVNWAAAQDLSRNGVDRARQEWDRLTAR